MNKITYRLLTYCPILCWLRNTRYWRRTEEIVFLIPIREMNIAVLLDTLSSGNTRNPVVFPLGSFTVLPSAGFRREKTIYIGKKETA